MNNPCQWVDEDRDLKWEEPGSEITYVSGKGRLELLETMKVVDINITPRDPENSYGRVNPGSSITISSYLLEFDSHRKESQEENNALAKRKWLLPFADENRTSHGLYVTVPPTTTSTSPDEEPSSSTRTYAVECGFDMPELKLDNSKVTGLVLTASIKEQYTGMDMPTTYNGLVGLLVVPAEKDENNRLAPGYRRVGLFEIVMEDSELEVFEGIMENFLRREVILY